MPDINKIVKSVRSVIHPGIEVPESAEKDPIAYRLVEIDKLIKEIAEKHAQLGKDLAKVNNMIIGLFEDLQKAKTQQG